MSVPTVSAQAAREARAREAHPARLGAYRLYERLGAGGHATVYRARRIGDPSAPDVALKRLHPHLTGTDYAVADFAREARVSGLLDHPVIRRVHALRREPTELYMTMEYVEGASLAAVLRRASGLGVRLPLGGVLAVLQRLCDALHHAHELVDETGRPMGFVHRDVSPSNLIVTPDGRLKLIDLGVIALRSAEATDPGLIKGKYAYMAPEVMHKQPFDRRADIFSLGVVAWELIAARRLYPSGVSPLEAVAQRARPVAPPSAHNRACPPELDAVVLRALATDPARRWPNCAEIALALRQIALDLGLRPSDAAIAELAAAPGEEPELETAPRPRLRLARGSIAPPRAPEPAPPEARVAPPPPPVRMPDARGRSWASLRALVGILATVVAAAVAGSALLTSVSLEAAGPAPPAPDTDADADAEPAAAAEPDTAAEPVAAEPDAAEPDAAAPDAAAPDAAAPDAAAEPDAAPLRVASAPPAPPAEAAWVDASELTRLDGPWPKSRSTDAAFRARVCIDPDGAVSSAEVLEGPERLVPRIVYALRRWRYVPYHQDGQARPACFEVNSRVEWVRRGDRQR